MLEIVEIKTQNDKIGNYQMAKHQLVFVGRELMKDTNMTFKLNEAC